jgi:PBP1b-binding outer membrane lipoprotein LpoB
MKKLYTITIAAGLAISLAGCYGPKMATSSDAHKMDAKSTCDVSKHGVEKVLAVAKLYNPIAVKNGVEFRRLNVKNSGYISAIEKALLTNSKSVDLIGKGKKIQKMEINWATQRSCTFALRALQQQKEAKSTWRMSVPGDGFTY